MSPKYRSTLVEEIKDEQHQDDEQDKQLQQICPEVEASFLSKLTFWWFNQLAIVGFKKSLVTSDLYLLNEDDRTNSIAPKFDRHWLSQLPRSERESDNHRLVSYRNNEANIETKVISGSKKQPGVLTTLSKTFGWYFFFGAILKLGYDLLQFIAPQLLK